MDINDILVSDEALSVIDNGAWVSPDDAPGLELKVTGLQSKEAQALMQSKQAVQRGKNRGKPLTTDQLAKITKEVLYESVLQDWRGLKADGMDLPYSRDLAKQWINSRNGERFTGMVLECAQKVDAEASDFFEEVVKN